MPRHADESELQGRGETRPWISEATNPLLRGVTRNFDKILLVLLLLPLVMVIPGILLLLGFG